MSLVLIVMFFFFFFFNDTATTEIYTVSYTLSLHDALPICCRSGAGVVPCPRRWPGRCRSEGHTSELQSQLTISYAVFCLKKKKKKPNQNNTTQYNMTKKNKKKKKNK